MNKPTFLFIGPDKTGSSWIFEYLNAHPQCFVPKAKDIYFFDREYHRGISWYKEFFNAAGPEHRAIGELSHDYILSNEVADRIRSDLPNVKLVSVIRNPVERAFSHYLYLKRSGMTTADFSEAIETFPEIIENSRYSVLLPRYIERFPKSQLCFLFFEDLRTRPQFFADQIADFLGVDRTDAQGIGIVRPASRARSIKVARLMKSGAKIARRIGLQNLVGVLKHSSVGRFLYVPIGDSDRQMMTPQDQERLDEIFFDEISWIEKFKKKYPHDVAGGDHVLIGDAEAKDGFA